MTFAKALVLVLIMEADALDLGWYIRGSCLVVFEPGDLSFERNSNGSLFERTNFKDLAMTKSYIYTVPHWGGIYARRVSVDASLKKLPKATSISSLIYATTSVGPSMVFRVSLEGGADSLAEWSKDWDRFREEVCEKIQMTEHAMAHIMVASS